MRRIPLSAKLNKHRMERGNTPVFLLPLAGIVSIRKCDRNSPFIQLQQLYLFRIEIRADSAQDARNGLKVRQTSRFRAFCPPYLIESFHVGALKPHGPASCATAKPPGPTTQFGPERSNLIGFALHDIVVFGSFEVEHTNLSGFESLTNGPKLNVVTSGSRHSHSELIGRQRKNTLVPRVGLEPARTLPSARDFRSVN